MNTHRQSDFPPGIAVALLVLSISTIRQSNAQAPVWTKPGGLNTGRLKNTATLLQNGKVLVAGGIDNSALSLASCELYDPATGSWTVTGSMNSARSGHSATLLPNGEVLVAGGQDGVSPLVNCELYNPATGSWTVTASMSFARSGQTATLLLNGQVLVAGGFNMTTDTYIQQTELYNPLGNQGAGSWTVTGSLNAPRTGHTATLLSSGQVLVAGGMNNSGFQSLSECELYNVSGSAAGTWSLTYPMSNYRAFHTATLLPNGNVLVAGGADQSGGGSSVSSAEFYTPNSGWTLAAGMTFTRSGHTATLLPDGNVLVVGGSDDTDAVENSAELYDSAENTWTTTASLNTARVGHTATLLPNGEVLVATGTGDGLVDGTLNTAELYVWTSGAWVTATSMSIGLSSQTATLLPNGQVLIAGGNGNSGTALQFLPAGNGGAGSWSGEPSMATARSSHTATLLPNGEVLVAGGQNGSGAIASAELYNPATPGWAATGPLNTARFNHTATLLTNGLVLVAGGATGFGGPLASAELFNPSGNHGAGSCAGINPMTHGRAYHTATLLTNGLVLVAGGIGSSSDVGPAELYDPVGGTWTVTGSLNTARDSHTATLLPNGQVLVAGGEDSSGRTIASFELYNPVNGTWTQPSEMMNNARYGHTATLLRNGQVLVAGGYSLNENNLVGSAELYDPALGVWALTGALNTARELHTATLLPNGQVLVAGGIGGGASAELYNVGLGFMPSWEPVISSTTSPLILGNNLVVNGGQFRGIGDTTEGSGGNSTQDSPADYPVVQLLSLANEQTLIVPAKGWSTFTFVSPPVPKEFPPGYALLTVFVNGIPSSSSIVNVVLLTGQSFTSTSPSRVSNGPFQCSFDSYAGAAFGVLTSTNIEMPLSNWAVLGSGVTEVSPGQYRFFDSQTTNIPQRFYQLSAQVGTTYIGNNLSITNGGVDRDPPLVILGEYSPAGPLPTAAVSLPSGTVQDVRFYGSNYNFTLYALSYLTNGPGTNEQTFHVVASTNFSGFGSSLGVQSLPVSSFSVNAGDFLAFAGTGPYYSQNSNDTFNSDATYENSSSPGSFIATAPGGAGTNFTVGIYTDPSAKYEYISDSLHNQGRNYAIGVDVLASP